ncbi:MAG: hypothetical protein KC594_18545 [Nitrospira sp.]|nr:hypothetical protein [Nitrospira sp.]
MACEDCHRILPVVTAIIGTTIVVRRKAEDVVGTLTVQEKPRFYFGFEPCDYGQYEGE